MLGIRSLAILACALSVSATQSLSLTVDTTANVDGISNLVVATTLLNTGDETLRILSDPLGPLSNLPADTFAVTNSNGEAAEFTGVKAKWVPTAAAEAGAFTTLEPGASITVQHDLSEAYNLTATGEGTYEIEPRNLFYLVGESNEITTIRATLDTAVTTSVSGTLARAQSGESTLSRRASFIGCSSTQQSQIAGAYNAAQNYASESRRYIERISSGTQRYNTWFGGYAASRKSTVQATYVSVSNNVFSGFTYDCTCSDSGTYAYVYSNQPRKIWLCGAFWRAPVTGTDSQGGTLLHEATHWNINGGTSDYAYGHTRAKSLAQSNPAQAVKNADSYDYFSENNPPLA